MPIRYLTLEQVVAIHDTLIEEFGGSFGIRDKGLLDSAIGQPKQSFGGQELFADIYEKAAAYAFFVMANHPFIDGNKRTAATAAAVFLDLNGYEIDCAEGKIYSLMMDLSNKRISRDDLIGWFRKNSIKKKS